MDNKYTKDGVNVEAGDAFSEYCGKMNQGTYGNSPYVEVYDFSQGNFRGPRGFEFKNLPQGCVKTVAADGVGTKVVVIVASGRLVTTVSNLIAMTAMDVTRWGGLPLVFSSILDVRSLGEVDSITYKKCLALIDGLGIIAKQNNYVSLTGETAEIGLCVGSENPNADLMFNWGGFMIGAYHPDKMILGNTLKPGQVIILLRDCFRSNGISSVRKALAIKHGPKWYNNPTAIQDVLDCATPSELYDRFLNYVHGWFNKDCKPIIPMHLISHITGGGFKGKVADILAKTDCSAVISDPFVPHPIMQEIAEIRGMSPEEKYESFNGGQGALVVVDKDRVADFLAMAKDFGIEAQEGGVITDKARCNVSIRSAFGDNSWIEF